MPIRYINMTGRVNDVNTVRLPNDFTQSTKDKYIIIKKVRLINNNGQLDIGCPLCGDFSDESCYSYGFIGPRNFAQKFCIQNFFAPKIL